jgi:hypothetical protein
MRAEARQNTADEANPAAAPPAGNDGEAWKTIPTWRVPSQAVPVKAKMRTAESDGRTLDSGLGFCSIVSMEIP